jgi:hypothetical protein
MEINQAFDPFRMTASSGKTNWVLPIVFLIVFAVVGYLIHRNNLDESSTR